MAWVDPMTVVAGTPITAAWANQDVRDNTAYLYGARGIFEGDVRFASVITCTMTTNLNNWTPVDDGDPTKTIVDCNVVRVSSALGGTISGIDALAPGATRIFINVGTHDISIDHDSGASDPAKRILLRNEVATYVWDINKSIWLWYDGVNQRWRLFE